MKMWKQIIEVLGLIFPLFKRRSPKEMQEFTDLVKGQYNYLMEIAEKSQKDYFTLSEQVKGMYGEIAELNRKLTEALALQCRVEDCKKRV